MFGCGDDDGEIASAIQHNASI